MIYNDTSESEKNKLDFVGFDYKSPTTYNSRPKAGNYQIGYINRYFVSRINYTDIVEVNSKDYNELSNIFYRKAKLIWKISGPKYNKYEDGILVEQGIYENNIANINSAKETIKDIGSVLTDVFQFCKK